MSHKVKVMLSCLTNCHGGLDVVEWFLLANKNECTKLY